MKWDKIFNFWQNVGCTPQKLEKPEKYGIDTATKWNATQGYNVTQVPANHKILGILEKLQDKKGS